MLEATLEKFYTVEEFWELCQLPEYTGRHLELVEGELVEMSPTGGEHGETTLDLSGRLWIFNREHRLGRLTAAETAYILYQDPDPAVKPTIRAPDVGFVRLERAPEPFGAGFIPLVPDLAVEVISPSEKVGDVENKLRDYLRYGVRLIWMIYPGSHVMVYSRGTVRRLIADDQLDGEDVLPGFSVRVGDMFPS
ncbi:MAG: Uma2 family endonuclease [Anaerolineae bacterium]|nr:Uma2 family endonuclease [Anaerolineae bacterium]